MTDEVNQRRRELAVAEHLRVEAPIVHELHEAGFVVDSLDDLRRSGQKYEQAIPILLQWLPKVNHLDVKESIIRTLSVPWARGVAARPLLEAFVDAPMEAELLKWAVGNALEVVATDDIAEDLLGIVSNPAHGITRQMFVLALGRLKHPDSIPTLRGCSVTSKLPGTPLRRSERCERSRQKTIWSNWRTTKNAGFAKPSRRP